MSDGYFLLLRNLGVDLDLGLASWPSQSEESLDSNLFVHPLVFWDLVLNPDLFLDLWLSSLLVSADDPLLVQSRISFRHLQHNDVCFMSVCKVDDCCAELFDVLFRRRGRLDAFVKRFLVFSDPPSLESLALWLEKIMD